MTLKKNKWRVEDFRVIVGKYDDETILKLEETILTKHKDCNIPRGRLDPNYTQESCLSAKQAVHYWKGDSHQCLLTCLKNGNTTKNRTTGETTKMTWDNQRKEMSNMSHFPHIRNNKKTAEGYYGGDFKKMVLHAVNEAEQKYPFAFVLDGLGFYNNDNFKVLEKANFVVIPSNKRIPVLTYETLRCGNAIYQQRYGVFKQNVTMKHGMWAYAPGPVNAFCKHGGPISKHHDKPERHLLGVDGARAGMKPVHSTVLISLFFKLASDGHLKRLSKQQKNGTAGIGDGEAIVRMSIPIFFDTPTR